MSFPRYEKYKDSGVEWLPQLPAHWRTGNLRWLSRRFSGGTPDKNTQEYWEDGTIPWLNSGAVNQALITEPSTYISVSAFENSSAKWIPAGALVMALAGQGKTKGMVAQLAIPSTCNQSMAAIVPTAEMNPRFLLWWLQSNYQNIRNMAGGDMRDGLNLDLLGGIPCPMPPLADQTTIAAFLDHETAKIDALVEEQERLIELLKEKRQAVISHAVTKGLNPNATMKDSRVEWLGEVPAHWTVSQMRYVVRKGTSITYGIVQAGPHVEDGVPYIKTSDMSGSTLPLSGYAKTSLEIDAAYARSRVTTGDLVMTIRASVGKCMPVPVELDGANLTQGTAKISPGPMIDGGFLLAYINSMPVQTYLDWASKGATFKEITLETLRKTPALVPPAFEQVEIASRARSLGDQFQSLIDQASIAVALLQERRTALISAAVTGKIDVRNMALKEGA